MIEEYKDGYKEDMLRLLDEFLLYASENYSVKEEFPCSEEILDSFLEHKFLVYLDSGVKGYIVGEVKGDMGEVKSFFVTEKFRGKGVGKKLYDFLMEWFKENYCKKIELDVFKGNKAIEMYEKWGFKQVRVRMRKVI